MTSRFRESLLPVAAAAVRAHPCEVCGKGATDAVGAFIPDDPEEFGAPASKTRVIFYPVHFACRQAATVDMLGAIEDRIRRRLLPPERN